MPTPPVVPFVCRWRILGTLANLAPWGVRFYTAYAGTVPNNATMLALAEAIAAAWNTHCNSLISNSVTTAEVDGVDLSSTEGASATAVVDDPGAVDSISCDNQVAATVKFDIDRRYRGGKPKMYIPGIPGEYQADGSHWSTDFVNEMGTTFTAFANAVTGLVESGTSLANIVNVPYYHGFTAVENLITGRWRNVPKYVAIVNPDIVSSYTCDSLLGSQKRRRVG